MIFVSSSCIKSKNILSVIETLSRHGIRNIELSGGTNPISNLEENLLKCLKEKSLNLRVHNYFPPPKEDFVINIASLNNEIYAKSIEHCIKAINLSKKIGSPAYSVHAGFLIDPGVKEIGLGKTLKKRSFYDENEAVEKMKKSLSILKLEAGNKIKLYVENNVLSYSNFAKYKNNPMLLCDLASYKKLKKKMEFNLLLDIAHLKVSCNTLKKDFKKESDYLLDQTDYIHLSGNDGMEDSNKSLINDYEIQNILKLKNFKNKTLTLEIYENIDEILNSQNYLKELIE